MLFRLVFIPSFFRDDLEGYNSRCILKLHANSFLDDTSFIPVCGIADYNLKLTPRERDLLSEVVTVVYGIATNYVSSA